MNRTRLLTRGLGLGIVAAAVATTTALGTPDVTKVRVEHALAPTFANLYVQQAAILGVPGITVEGTAASAACDRGGPKVADVGSGADWICMVTFHDHHGTVQTGTFELQVKAEAAYVAGGPSKLIGLVTITDKSGKDVPNPVFEFDGSLNPDQ
ncbi:hypothetical protein QMK19_37345 [Streptomyces sp. H10-C2]|uniref:hypothetical protein n=1 Tax=unclassified Streptomyces TaxID=2593676 RepID=UPI0024BB5575|nr:MULTISPECIES: hypothetical protein [unclassified Streptomyces]MDJ0347326.1 hypothetical protein [Streptomyces sp. PH10-H1]MDJ0375123.1 hypothetical protein [Streptomyces sp. H10-C2]